MFTRALGTRASTHLLPYAQRLALPQAPPSKVRPAILCSMLPCCACSCPAGAAQRTLRCCCCCPALSARADPRPRGEAHKALQPSRVQLLLPRLCRVLPHGVAYSWLRLIRQVSRQRLGGGHPAALDWPSEVRGLSQGPRGSNMFNGLPSKEDVFTTRIIPRFIHIGRGTARRVSRTFASHDKGNKGNKQAFVGCQVSRDVHA